MNADGGLDDALTKTFLVERYWPGVTVDAFAEAVRRVRESIDGLRSEGEAIQTMSSTLVPTDEAAYWVVAASSADIVELAYARAGVPYERIVGALEAERAQSEGRLAAQARPRPRVGREKKGSET